MKANNSNEDVGNDGEGDDEIEADEGAAIEKVEINNVLLRERTILKYPLTFALLWKQSVLGSVDDSFLYHSHCLGHCLIYALNEFLCLYLVVLDGQVPMNLFTF